MTRARSLFDRCRYGTMTRETRSSAASPRVPRHEDVTAQTLGNTETRSQWREASCRWESAVADRDCQT
jgi:hypothetical protein